MVADSRRSAQIYIPTSDTTGTMATSIRQNVNLYYATRFERLQQEVGMQGCEHHQLSPDSDCELCRFRQLVLPIGKTSSEMTLVTVQNERIVTKEDIQDSESSASAGSCSQSGQRFLLRSRTRKYRT